MRFSNRISRLKASPIRDMLHVLDRPDMISFAGGLPAAESFPDICNQQIPKSVLQYGASEGEAQLRQLLAEKLSTPGQAIKSEQVFILSGSQQGIDLVAKLFVDERTMIAMETPSYLAAIQVFKLFGADFIPFDQHDLAALANQKSSPALLYVNPTFQNPTGNCYTAAERTQLAKICDQNNIVLFEDDPYRDLAYEKCDREPIFRSLNSSAWIYQSSFSKTFAPGLRLAFLACAEPLIPYFSRLKQAADLHSNRLSQHLVFQHLQRGEDGLRLAKLQTFYRKKRDLFNEYLNTYLGEYATWETPKGGLFFWLKFTQTWPLDTRSLLELAIERNCAFMPGEPFFFAPCPASNRIRLNFSLASEQQMASGLQRLRGCVQDFFQETGAVSLTQRHRTRTIRRHDL